MKLELDYDDETGDTPTATVQRHEDAARDMIAFACRKAQTSQGVHQRFRHRISDAAFPTVKKA